MKWYGLEQYYRGRAEETGKKCVDQVTAQYGNTIMSSSARNTYLAKRVERITDRTIWALAEQVKKEILFRPVLRCLFLLLII